MDGVEITAGRLHLRPWRPEDAPAVHVTCQDPEIRRWIAAIPSPYGEADAREYVGRIAPEGWEAGTEATFAVLDATSARLLASVGLHHIDRKDALAHVGFWCAAPERGRGVTTTAVRAVCRWGFAALGLGRIEWYAEVGNTASRRVADKAGFVLEATPGSPGCCRRTWLPGSPGR
jgi:RimJ/RimL family protein N-acetyltransferase